MGSLVLDGLSTLRTKTGAFIRNRLSDWDHGPRSFAGKLSGALALMFAGLYRAVKSIDNDSPPSSKSSTQGLDDWTFVVGLPNGAGGYGRHVPVAATGGAGLCTGVAGVTFTDGATLTASDGVTKFQLSGAVVIAGTPPATGSIAGVFVAVTEGAAGNLDAGEVLTWDSPPADADPTVTLTTGLSGGLDEETNAAAFARFLRRMQVPPKGGASGDYKSWSEDAETVIGFVYPRRSGTGTVDVVITQAGSGTARAPSSTIVTSVDAALEELRPVAAEAITTRTPYMPAAAGKTLRVRVTPSADAYAFDWIDTSGFTVAVWAAGPPAVLTLSADAPASLVAAIDAYKADAGDAPRLQVMATAGPAVPVQVRVVDYSGGGNRALELENPLPSGFLAPSVGNAVYSGGPICDMINNALLDLVDSLGPSRAGGYGDATIPWNDTLSISGMTAAAENAEDTDGTKLISKCLVNGTTIDGSEADAVGTDDTSNGPMLLYAKNIATTQ